MSMQHLSLYFVIILGAVPNKKLLYFKSKTALLKFIHSNVSYEIQNVPLRMMQ